MRHAFLALCLAALFSTGAVAATQSHVQYTLDGKNVDSSVVMNNGQVSGTLNSNSFFNFHRMGRVNQKSTICIGKVKCKSGLRMTANKAAYANLNQ